MLLYHSGSGSTKRIGESLIGRLTQHDIVSQAITYDFDFETLQQYDAVIVGFPTYHCDASPDMWKFLKRMPMLKKSMPCFIFTTCGLYSGNAIRKVAKYLKKKALVCKATKVFVGPGSDVAIMMPFVPNLFLKYRKNTAKRLDCFAEAINDEMFKRKGESAVSYIPIYQLLVVLNVPNELGGKLMSKHLVSRIKVDNDRCTKCKLCVSNCINGCFSENESGIVFDSTNCGYCFKCMHHCPAKAINFSKAMKDRIRLDNVFYSKFEL